MGCGRGVHVCAEGASVLGIRPLVTQHQTKEGDESTKILFGVISVRTQFVQRGQQRARRLGQLSDALAVPREERTLAGDAAAGGRPEHVLRYRTMLIHGFCILAVHRWWCR